VGSAGLRRFAAAVLHQTLFIVCKLMVWKDLHVLNLEGTLKEGLLAVK
jgi:hypothetical protein